MIYTFIKKEEYIISVFVIYKFSNIKISKNKNYDLKYERQNL